MEDIDAKTDRLLQRTNSRVATNAAAPVRNEPVPRANEPELTVKSPDTNNPDAADLAFDMAAENRDVAARLRSAHADALEYDPELGSDSPAPGEELRPPAALVGATELDLVGCWRQAQRTAREHASAQDDYLLAAIRLLIERHQWDPRLFHTASAVFSSDQFDGNIDSAVRIVNDLAVRQQLPFGGEVAARWVWQATENLRSEATGQYEQSSSLILDASIPLLRGAGDVAQESLIQGERSLIYAARDYENFRRDFLVSIASDFFNLLQQRDGIKSQREQLQSLRLLEDRQKAWYDAGLLPEFDVNLATNNVLNAQANLANQRETYVLALDRFKVRLGIPVRTPVVIKPSELLVPEPEVSMDRATELALAYRLDLQNRRDQVDDSKRQIANAANALLPDLDVFGNVTFPTDADAREGGVVYEPDDVRYSAGLTFGLPLDRESERLALRSADISWRQAVRDFEQFRDNVVLDVRGKVREIDRARFNLELARERVRITERRKEEQTLKEDEVDTQSKIDTENDLLQARRAEQQAVSDLRNSVLDYLLATGQMRVGRNGVFEPLPGMELPAGVPPLQPPGPDPAAPANP